MKKKTIDEIEHEQAYEMIDVISKIKNGETVKLKLFLDNILEDFNCFLSEDGKSILCMMVENEEEGWLVALDDFSDKMITSNLMKEKLAEIRKGLSRLPKT